MSNPDPQVQVVFDAVVYSTTGDNSSAIINVPSWAERIILYLEATHAGTLDTIAHFPGDADSIEFDSARATAVGISFIYNYVPRIQFVWASGTAAAGTVNANVVFSRGK